MARLQSLAFTAVMSGACGLGTTGITDETSTGEPATTSAPVTSTGEGVTTTEVVTSSSTEPETLCGNGIVEDGEECDDGNNVDEDDCRSTCISAICGDGVVGPGEQCDDGNMFESDSCTNVCANATCGDLIVGPGEECDDANGFDADACTNVCKLATCGDAVVGPGEECDDGVNSGEPCKSDCTLPSCGDNVVQRGEECDDEGMNGPGMKCSSSCRKTEIADIVIGGDNTCLRFKNGTIRCWGANDGGQLGNGTLVGQVELPADDIIVGAEVASLALGVRHACALTNEKTVRCWGDNSFGQLGIGDIIEENQRIGDEEGEMPPSELKLGDDVLQVTAGLEHTCVLMATRRVRCWGNGMSGRLGRGNNDSAFLAGETSASDVLGVADVVEISAGGSFTCALTGAGAVYCWGENGFGQLGRGHTVDVSDPTGKPTNVGGSAKEIRAGTEFACVRFENENVACWGYNANGQLGIGQVAMPFDKMGDQPGEMPPAIVLMGVSQLVVASNHSCVLSAQGEVRCWGWGINGRLGYGNKFNVGDNFNELANVPDVDLGGASLLLSGHLSAHTCVLMGDERTLRCWGDNDNGQLGLGHKNDYGDDPGEVPGMTTPIPY